MCLLQNWKTIGTVADPHPYKSHQRSIVAYTNALTFLYEHVIGALVSFNGHYRKVADVRICGWAVLYRNCNTFLVKYKTMKQIGDSARMALGCLAWNYSCTHRMHTINPLPPTSG